MPVKNTVAVERRTDLASLFCMIGRHGPAVALAVIAMVSVVAGFILYRNVRGKRRKAPVGEAAEGDASMTGTDEETEPEASASTDPSEGSSYLKVEPDFMQSGPRIRHRRSPSAEKPPVFCPPQVETSAVQDYFRVAETHEEEDVQNLQCDSTAMADVDYRRSSTDDTAMSVTTGCCVEKLEHVYEETLTADLKQDWCRVTNNVVLSNQEDDHFQTIEVTEEFRDDTSLDTDTPPIEASQTNTLSLEENSDGSKKVLAVQPMPQNVNVTFSIHYLTHSPYQKLAVTGSHEELGNWKDFIPLEKAKDGHWSTVVGLPAESNVEWKFVVLDKGGVCRWEECGNRLLETGYGDDLVVHKWWGFL